MIIPLILILDQGLKFWIKTHLFLGEEFNVIGDWFRIHFTENPGMAFGLEMGGKYGKLALSSFRIIAVIFIIGILIGLVRKNANGGLIFSISLILAGAIGNIIDSAFYGLIFSESYGTAATFLPEGGGYGTFLQGKVVDMLYFPLFNFQFPEWVPFVGKSNFLFFSPVFNIADSAITVGVFLMIVFQRKFFSKMSGKEKKEPESESVDDISTEEATG